MYVGTYTSVQGEYFRKQIIPKFQTEFNCKILQTENVTLGNIGILRTQKANPNYGVMMMDDVGVPIAKAEGLIDKLPADKIPNMVEGVLELHLQAAATARLRHLDRLALVQQ